MRSAPIYLQGSRGLPVCMFTPQDRYYGNHFLMVTLYSCIASGTM